MTFSLKLFTRNQMTVVAGLMVAALCLVAIGPAMAGGDTTFSPMTTQLSGWLSGSLGYMIALVSFFVGVVNAVQGNRGFWGMVFPFFLSIIIGVGITVIQGGFTAVI
jgi:hypothetical protein